MSPWAPFEWITAIRFLKEGRMQTVFIIIGIAIGVSVIIFMSALLTGLQGNFVKRVLTSQPHIQLVPSDEVARPLRTGIGIIEAAVVQPPSQRIHSIDQWQEVQRQLQLWPTITNVTPTVSASALIVHGDTSRSISMTGIVPEVYFNIVTLPDYIILGHPDLSSQNIIIGKDLAGDLGVTIGDKLNITAASGITQPLVVSAIFDLGNKGANSRSTYVALRTAQTIANLPGGVTTIDVTVNDAYAAETVAQAIQATTGVQADSWIKTNAQFFTAVQTQNISFGIIRVFVGLSVAFGMASVLIVSVIQRSKDIGILRAMGATRRQILRLFLLQGGLLGLLGALVGSAIGAAAILLFATLMRQADGSQLFPMTLEAQLFALAVGLASLTGVAAAAVPALQAAQLDPVVAIRG